MGYFSNGTEGSDYEGRVCSRCVHMPDDPADGGCPIWMLHLLWNYEQQDDEAKELALNIIPRDGIRNGLCTMFHGKTKRDDFEVRQGFAGREASDDD